MSSYPLQPEAPTITPSGSGMLYRTSVTELRVSSPGRGVFHSELRGELTPHAMRWALGEMQRVLDRDGRLRVFHDWLAMTKHAPGARADATRWILARRDRVEALHVLLVVQSKILAMAIEATNLVLGGFMVVHTDRASFERARAKG